MSKRFSLCGWLSPLAFCLLISPASAAERLAAQCNGCHGADGISTTSHLPSIAGLNFRYFYKVMQDYRKDRRPSTVMGRIAKGYKSGQLQRLALHYGRQAWAGHVIAGADGEQVARGAQLHEDLCAECHEQGGRYQDKDTPPLAGQARGYLLAQMQAYRRATADLPQPALMQERLERLSDGELAALSTFYASPAAWEEVAAAATAGQR